jgi:hypothetical protein
MRCVEKKVLIVFLILLAIYFLYSLRIEKFSFNEYKNRLETKISDTKVIDVNMYNYHPIGLQCTNDSKEIRSIDPNTILCKKENKYVDKDCPKEMLREGDLCYMPCDNNYSRFSGLCWKK